MLFYKFELMLSPRVKKLTTTQPSKPQGTLRRWADAFSAGLRLKLASKTNRWRLALLVFMVVYAVFLLLNLGYMSFQWDEMPHMNGGLLLSRGQTGQYLTIYGYYPPVYDIATTGFYQLFGVSAASGRLAAVAFSLLAIWIVFEFANRTYGPRIALLSSVLLGTMPGFFWLSRVAMLETMLIFFFSLTLFFFLTWLHNEKDRTLILSALALGVGILAKYQILVAGLVMIVGILLWGRKKLRWRFAKFLLIPLIAALVVVPWLVVLYQAGGMNNFGKLLYTITEGHEERLEYSARFPLPVFYLIEMTWPFSDIPVHPISLPIYILGLLGLGVWAWRRKPEDKFFLAWFAVVYVFFTLIPNKQWRYITPIFPTLAISAAAFVMFIYDRAAATWKRQQTSLNKKRLLKVAAGLFVVLTATAIVYSSYEAYEMTARDQIHIPVEEATSYAVNHMKANESIVVLLPFNMLNQDMVWFYLPADRAGQTQVLQYPELAIDAFTLDFNVTELISLCEQKNVKYVFLYEHANVMEVYEKLYDTGRFTYEHVVGDVPRSISILAFA
jgi:4-amino-4-deoxy-L-arabinose transferase-like glycosyltransferase